MKKIISFLLAIVLVVSTCAFSLTASAETEYTEGYYTYEISDEKVTITDVDESISGDITIPSTLGGYPVTSIGKRAFDRCTSLTDIVIPDSVTNIDSYSFSNCKSLTSLTIGNSVKSIGDYAFAWCESLKNLTIPDSVISINEFAFYLCSSLTDATIGDGVKSIGKYSFYFCTSLTNVIIGDSVTSIGESAFGACSLTSITIPNSVVSIERYAFIKCDIAVVYYRGSIEQMLDITIDADNSPLTNAVWYYNSCIGASNHTYDNNCDGECNVCGDIRNTIGHRYDEHITQATCITDGYIVYYCVGCGDSYTVDLPASGHDYDDGFDVVCNNCEEQRAYISGDANGDGKLNGRDYAIILQYLNDWNVKIDIAATDVNDDCEINGRDASILIQYLCNKIVELK